MALYEYAITGTRDGKEAGVAFGWVFADDAKSAKVKAIVEKTRAGKGEIQFTGVDGVVVDGLEVGNVVVRPFVSRYDEGAD